MTSSRRILVVTPTPSVARSVIHCLSAARYRAIVRADFLAARSEIDEHAPDLLVTEVRLGAFNGLHLAIRARGRGAHTQTIVIGAPDSVLEAEASRQEIAYLTLPLDEDMFVVTTRRILQQAESLSSA